MQKKKLYRYERDGKIIDTLKKPKDIEYTLRYRLIADMGKILVNGNIETECVDIDKNELIYWHEVDKKDAVTSGNE
jgi:hypothetical protein